MDRKTRKKYAVVGSGLYGASVAYLLNSRSPAVSVCVYESRELTGGNVRTVFSPEIKCHVPIHGAHIFHTNSQRVWAFINAFSEFNSYQHYVRGELPDGSTVSLPFGMDAFEKILGIRSPEEAQQYLERLSVLTDEDPSINQNSVEGWCLANIGAQLYEAMVKPYTEKQWGRPCSELPASIIQRLPIRFTYDTTYFKSAKYQGMPVEGYTRIIDLMLQDSTVILGTAVDRQLLKDLCEENDQVFFSGQVDALFDYDLGVLPYRGLKFQDRYYDMEFYQGVPVINDLTSNPSTRTIEHKMFYPEISSPTTLVTEEFPAEWKPGLTPYYPVRDEASTELYERYVNKAREMFPNLVLGGRLGAYRYYDMDQVIGMAMSDVNTFAPK